MSATGRWRFGLFSVMCSESSAQIRMKYETALRKTDPAGCRKHSHGDGPHENQACCKPVECVFLTSGQIFFPTFSFHFYFMLEKAGNTEAPHLRISPREPLKQLVANLSLYPAPLAPEHQFHRLSGRSVRDFADERSKIPFLSHPVNTPQTCRARPFLGCTT